MEESEQQLKRTVEGIQGATSELVDITQKKEARRLLLIKNFSSCLINGNDAYCNRLLKRKFI